MPKSYKDGGDWINDIEDFKAFTGLDKAEERFEKSMAEYLLKDVDIEKIKNASR